MNNESLQDHLNRTAPELTPAEQDVLFARIEARLTPAVVPSPYQSFTFFSKPMSYLALLLVLVLGASGTVAASESAKPGDLLFPIERASEQLRLSLASDDKKAELENRFLDERFAELATLFDEATIATTATATDDFLRGSSTAWLATSSVSFEADIFADVTVVKVEVNDTKAYFTTGTTTRAGVVNVIAERYGLTPEFVNARLDIETEDRASRPTDLGRTVSVVDEERIAAAIAVLLGQASTMDDASTGDRLRALLADVENIIVEGRGNTLYTTDDVRIKVSDNRVEVRTDTERIRLEDKNGEVRIKYDSDDEDNGFGNDDERYDDRDARGRDDEDQDQDDDQSSSSSASSLEVEADVFSDVTLVKVELNDRTTTFTMSASSSRAAVVSEVARRYNLPESQVTAVLDYEVENRASRPNDTNNSDPSDRDDGETEDREDSGRSDNQDKDNDRADDSDDKEKEDKSDDRNEDNDKDEDENRDEDNSGHGGGDDNDDREED
jgi:hypothetical protein